MQPKAEEQERINYIEGLLRTRSAFSMARAEQLISEWEEAEPDGYFPNFYRGVWYALRGEHEKALLSFQCASKIRPSASMAWYNVSSTQFSLGDFEGALDSAKQALLLSQSISSTVEAISVAAWALIELYRFGEARDLLLRIRGVGVELNSLFYTYVAQGQIKDAVLEIYALGAGGTGKTNILETTPHDPKIIRSTLLPLLEFSYVALGAGYSPDQILESLDLPPGDINPGTPEYIDWWRQELHDPDWEEITRTTLDIIATPPTKDEDEAEGSALSLESVEFEGERYTFKRPLDVQVRHEGEAWSHESKEFGTMGHGRSCEESFEATKAYLSYLWHEIAQRDDAQLASGASALKQKMLTLVERVEAV